MKLKLLSWLERIFAIMEFTGNCNAMWQCNDKGNYRMICSTKKEYLTQTFEIKEQLLDKASFHLRPEK